MNKRRAVISAARARGLLQRGHALGAEYFVRKYQGQIAEAAEAITGDAVTARRLTRQFLTDALRESGAAARAAIGA